MVMFIAHIAFISEIIGFAAGLVLLHYGRQHGAKLIKTAAILLILFGTSGVICTGYYAIKYFFMGHYEHAYETNGLIK